MRRTVQFVLALQLAGVCFAGQPIAIMFDFSARPNTATILSMQSEIREILAPAQLDLIFQPIDQSQTQSFRKIVIVRFRGTCEARAQLALPINETMLVDFPALGRTYISGGHVLPYVQVYCDEVRDFVPLTGRQPPAKTFG